MRVGVLSCVSLWGALCGCVSWGVAACCVAPLSAQQGSVGTRLGMGCSRFPWQQQGGARKHQLRKEGCSCAREPEGLAEQAPGTVCAIVRRSCPWLHPVPPSLGTSSCWYGFFIQISVPWVPVPPFVALGGLSVSPARGLCVGTHGYPSSRSAVAPCGHSPAGPGDSPQLLGSRERRTELQDGHQSLDPAAVVTRGFDGTARWAVR